MFKEVLGVPKQKENIPDLAPCEKSFKRLESLGISSPK
jgi:hypothetical protein